MLVRGLYIENATEAVDIRIKDGRFETIAAGLTPLSGEEVIDCGGKLALPPYIESHIHLDSVLTAGDPVWNKSGTLFEGIECWGKRKQKLTKQDVKERVTRALRKQAVRGVQYVRTHVDTTDPKLTAMEALVELRDEVKDLITIQIVAFPQEGILSYPGARDLLKQSIEMGADAVGGIPHFEFTREYSVESLNIAMEMAQKYNKLVDIHCDEIDDEAARGLETVAARAYEMQLFEKVTASHTTAMHSYNNAYVVRLMRLLKMSRINFIANPLVNTHLQGRMDTYPKRRGLTRVKELLAEGINVAFGNDDMFDPWYPLGNGNMRDVVFLGLHVCQLMGYEELMNGYKFVTTNAAKALCLSDDEYGFKPGNPASFVVMDAPHYYDALNNHATVLYSYRNGKLLAQSTPGEQTLHY